MTESLAFVRLTTERKLELLEQLAVHHATLEDLETKKKLQADKLNGDIKVEEGHIARIMRLVRNDGENRDQLDLFVGEGDSRVTEEAAKQALAAVMARQPGCTPINARSCSCEPMLRKCATCDHVETENPGQGVYMCPNCPDTTLLQVVPEGDAPDVSRPRTCPIHGVGAPHATEPPPVEALLPTEDDEIQATAQAFVASLNGNLPEGLGHTNHLVTGFFAATDVPRKRRGRVRTAIDALLGAAKLPPANAGTSDEPVEEESAAEEANA